MACIINDYFYYGGEIVNDLHKLMGNGFAYDQNDFSHQALQGKYLCINGVSFVYDSQSQNYYYFWDSTRTCLAMFDTRSSHGELHINYIFVSDCVPYLDQEGYVLVTLCDSSECTKPITDTCLFEVELDSASYPNYTSLDIPIDGGLLERMPEFIMYINGVPFVYSGTGTGYYEFLNEDLQCFCYIYVSEVSPKSAETTYLVNEIEGCESLTITGDTVKISVCSRKGGGNDDDETCPDIPLMEYVTEHDLPYTDYFDDNGTFIPQNSGGGGGSCECKNASVRVRVDASFVTETQCHFISYQGGNLFDGDFSVDPDEPFDETFDMAYCGESGSYFWIEGGGITSVSGNVELDSDVSAIIHGDGEIVLGGIK